MRLPLTYYRPTIVRPISYGRRTYYLKEPLYYNYLFLRVHQSLEPEMIQNLLPIRFVVFRPRGKRLEIGYIVEVPDEEVQRIRGRSHEISEDYCSRFKGRDFGEQHKGRDVVITGGAFAGSFGKITGPASAGQVWLDLKIFNRRTRCMIGVDSVELIKR